ncbi:MAG: hypothetical protein K0S61_1389 [Anaerocolumna sp.]|jgi:hypothetical protein|nr:hypothetical protein [Anaerocolumna sp.]
MFEERKISTEDALRLACKANGLKYIGTGNKPKKTITLVDDYGNKTVVDRNLDIIGQCNHKDCTITDIETTELKCKRFNFEAAKDSSPSTNGNVGRFMRKVYGEHNYIKIKPHNRNSE